MKLKYYLRGLSIGILFATVVLSISFRTNSKSEITDEEIIKKAEELGMMMRDDGDLKLGQLLNGLITPTVIATTELNNEPTEAVTSKDEITTVEPTPTIDPVPSIEPTKVVEPKVDITHESKPSDDDVKIGEYITFEILPGMTSYEVSKLLKDKGLIDDVWKFNQYMAENKYVRIIDFGTYKIKKGSTHQEIASKIIIK